jgi:hypothetical protein
MSTAQSASGGSNGGREFGATEWAGAPWRRRGCGASRWTAFEIIAMVLGFIVFWPIGLAILAFKFWQRKSGAPDLQTVATGAWNDARAAMSGASASTPRPWASWSRGSSAAPTGNRAFDEWKGAELARLEEERRKLEGAHREFAEFLETIRKAKDREEFDRFMNERRNRATDHPGETS